MGVIFKEFVGEGVVTVAPKGYIVLATHGAGGENRGSVRRAKEMFNELSMGKGLSEFNKTAVGDAKCIKSVAAPVLYHNL